MSATDVHLTPHVKVETHNYHLKQAVYGFNYLPAQTRSYHLFFLSLHFVCVCVCVCVRARARAHTRMLSHLVVSDSW